VDGVHDEYGRTLGWRGHRNVVFDPGRVVIEQPLVSVVESVARAGRLDIRAIAP